MKKLTTEIFIERSVAIHGDRYDYSLSEYKGSRVKVKIKCPEHGIFEQEPVDHLRGRCCYKCTWKNNGIKLRDTKEQFIIKSKDFHGDRYNYSLVEYINSNTKVKIICPIHGVFEQNPASHVCGKGCFKCGHGTGQLLSYYKTSPKGQELGHNYKIRIFNNEESFIKRGITSKTIDMRFRNNLPDKYNYEILEDNIMTNLECAIKEKEDEIKYKNFKYKPQIKFCGYTECYTK